MIIYWSMMLWVPLIYFVYSMTNKKSVDLRDNDVDVFVQTKVPLVYAIVVFGYFIFWIGMRKYVFDTTQYIFTFESIPNNFSVAWSEIDWDSKGPFFTAYEVIFKCFISDNYTWWLMSIAIGSGLCLIHTLRKYSTDFFYSCFLFISLGTFIWMLNGMRQFVAVSILFLCCDLIKDGKFIKFLMLTIFVSQIHTTALLMIPIYFVSRGKPWSGRVFGMVTSVVLICIFAEPFFTTVDKYTVGTAYEGERLLVEGDDGVHPLRVLLYSMPPLIAFFNRKKLEKYYSIYPILPISINMSLICAMLYLVGMFTSGILVGRFPIYAELYDLILIPFLMKLCFDDNDRLTFISVTTIVLIIYFYLVYGELKYHSELTGTIT